ncbi:hypothetical protein JTE78_12215 [Pseudomonas syringae pv. aptata]|uniref:hypothetical protein n=1 Tax=Pseudomonas syringae TaxID=317 RepID=UPI00203F49C6|nr:hypothetical protein [Pseudomonas syringae]MCK0543527.1 hypothetical protein [Pseudomonas syringae pv. aptata]
MSKHPIPDWLRSQFSRIEDEVRKLGPCGVFTQMRTVTQTYFEQQAAAPQPPALGDDIDDALRDLASSACQIALENGINEEAFLRLARSVRQRIEVNKTPALGGEPKVVGYRIDAEAPATSGYTLNLNPVAEGKYQVPVTDLSDLAPLQAEIEDYKAGQDRYEKLCEDQRTEISQLKARCDELEGLLRDLESGSGTSPGANKKWAKVRAFLSKPAGSEQV